MCPAILPPDSLDAPSIARVLADLRGCLADLDALKAARAGTYLSMAIDVLCLEHGPAARGGIASARIAS